MFETLAIRGSSWWISALMWTPAAASVVARLALHDGFGDVSFRLGGRRGSKAIGLALIFPVVIGLIAYGIAWTTGLVQFSPRPIMLAAPYIANTTSPGVVFVINLAVAATVGTPTALSRRPVKRSAGVVTCSRASLTLGCTNPF